MAEKKKKGKGKRRSKKSRSKKKDAGKVEGEKSKADVKAEGKEEAKADAKAGEAKASEAKADAKGGEAKADGGKSAPPAAGPPPSSVAYVSANPEAVPKNKDYIDKIINLFSTIKLDQVTKQHREDLAKVQILIKNIQFRDYNEPSRVCEVHLNEHQKAVIKIVCEGKVDADDGFGDTMMVTVTKDNGKPNSPPPPIPTKINYAFEQLAFQPTKVVKS